MASFLSFIWFITFVAQFLASLGDDFTCTSDYDCSLGGKCINNTYCKCDPTWRSYDCSVLNLLASKTSRAFYRPTESSWGGSVLYDNNTGLYHMFVSDMSFHCGLHSWEYNSRVVHAISYDPEGPFNDTNWLNNIPNRQNVASDIWSHNPTAHYVPSQKLYKIENFS